jgi:8-oxo-dGTP pyrophosphatase MutT (NUDIX family)
MSPAHHQLPHHFTASALTVCGNHILLVHHKRIGAWVPPGGHIEDNEMPEECVIREVLEETGVTVEVISPERPSTQDMDAFFLLSPLYVQAVLAIEKGERFYHVDLAYLCRPSANNQLDELGLPRLSHNPEVKEARWVLINEASRLHLAKNVAAALSLLQSEARALL